MPGYFDGFIVHSYTRTKAKRTHLYFIGRLSSGETFAAVDTRTRPSFYVRRSYKKRAREGTALEQASFQEVAMRTMDGEPCLKLGWNTHEARQNGRALLTAAGLRTYEADLRITDQYRLDRSIHGAVRLSGDFRPGRRVGRVFMNPDLRPSDWLPQLSLLSIDIETNPESSEVLALGFFFIDPAGGLPRRTIQHRPFRRAGRFPPAGPGKRQHDNHSGTPGLGWGAPAQGFSGAV